jgi:hypothetical protein
MKKYLKWSYLLVFLFGIFVGYIGIPMLSRYADYLF